LERFAHRGGCSVILIFAVGSVFVGSMRCDVVLCCVVLCCVVLCCVVLLLRPFVVAHQRRGKREFFESVLLDSILFPSRTFP
jgi:hypothetical protein